MSLATGLVVACDPGIRIHGRVVSGSRGAIPYATVALECPSPNYYDLPPTWTIDEDGGFGWATLGCLPKACWFHVATDAGESTIRVADVCKGTTPICGSQSCDEIPVMLTLP